MPEIAVLCKDLMFTVKIGQAAKTIGANARFLSSAPALLEAAQNKPDLLVLDLVFPDADVLGLIGSLKANEATRSIPLLGYVPHVQVDLRQAALEKGCDAVVARSTFSDRLPLLLEQYLGSRKP